MVHCLFLFTSIFVLVCFCFLFWPLGGRDWQWLWTAKPIFSHGFKAAFTIYHPYIFILQQTNDFEFQRRRYIDLHVSNHLAELFCEHCHLLFKKSLKFPIFNEFLLVCCQPCISSENRNFLFLPVTIFLPVTDWEKFYTVRYQSTYNILSVCTPPGWYLSTFEILVSEYIIVVLRSNIHQKCLPAGLSEMYF